MKKTTEKSELEEKISVLQIENDELQAEVRRLERENHELERENGEHLEKNNCIYNLQNALDSELANEHHLIDLAVEFKKAENVNIRTAGRILETAVRMLRN